MTSSLSNTQYTARSMNGVISISDGILNIENGTITNAKNINSTSVNSSTITSGTINTGSLSTDIHVINNSLTINGNTSCVSVGTGTLVVNGGGISTTGNVWIGKDLHCKDLYSNNISYHTSINSTDISCNTLNSVVINNSGKITSSSIYSTDISFNNLQGNISASLGSVIDTNLAIGNNLSLAGKITCSNSIMCGSKLTCNGINILSSNNLLPSCGQLAGYSKIQFNHQDYCIPIFFLP
jgi:hypothetical protein